MELPAESLYEMGQKGSRMVFMNFDYKNIAKLNAQLYEWIVCGGEVPSFLI